MELLVLYLQRSYSILSTKHTRLIMIKIEKSFPIRNKINTLRLTITDTFSQQKAFGFPIRNKRNTRIGC